MHMCACVMVSISSSIAISCFYLGCGAEKKRAARSGVISYPGCDARYVKAVHIYKHLIYYAAKHNDFSIYDRRFISLGTRIYIDVFRLLVVS